MGEAILKLIFQYWHDTRPTPEEVDKTIDFFISRFGSDGKTRNCIDSRLIETFDSCEELAFKDGFVWGCKMANGEFFKKSFEH